MEAVVCVAVSFEVLSGLKTKDRGSGFENVPESLTAVGSIFERSKTVQMPHPCNIDGGNECLFIIALRN